MWSSLLGIVFLLSKQLSPSRSWAPYKVFSSLRVWSFHIYCIFQYWMVRSINVLVKNCPYSVISVLCWHHSPCTWSTCPRVGYRPFDLGLFSTCSLLHAREGWLLWYVSPNSLASQRLWLELGGQEKRGEGLSCPHSLPAWQRDWRWLFSFVARSYTRWAFSHDFSFQWAIIT